MTRLERLFEAILREEHLRENPTSISTGGLLGQKCAQICARQEKPIIELLKLATSEIVKDNNLIPQIKNKSGKFINILEIQDENQRNNYFNTWVSEVTNSFIETFKIRNLSNDEKRIVMNYFRNITTQQPHKGKEDYLKK